MAKLSVSDTPVCFSASRRSQRIFFSVWSGQDGYPGAGLIPLYFSFIRSSELNFSLFSVSPEVPYLLMNHLSKSLGYPVSQHTCHNRIVIIPFFLEISGKISQLRRRP